MTALAVAVVVCVAMLARTVRHDRLARELDARSVRATQDAICAYEAADDLLMDALGLVGEWSAT